MFDHFAIRSPILAWRYGLSEAEAEQAQTKSLDCCLHHYIVAPGGFLFKQDNLLESSTELRTRLMKAGLPENRVEEFGATWSDVKSLDDAVPERWIRFIEVSREVSKKVTSTRYLPASVTGTVSISGCWEDPPVTFLNGLWVEQTDCGLVPPGLREAPPLKRMLPRRFRKDSVREILLYSMACLSSDMEIVYSLATSRFPEVSSVALRKIHDAYEAYIPRPTVENCSEPSSLLVEIVAEWLDGHHPR